MSAASPLRTGLNSRVTAPPEKANPAAAATADGALFASTLENRLAQPSSNDGGSKPALRVRIDADGRTVTTTGREAQTLAHLIACGAGGFTSGEASPLGWARRTSAYVFKLRRLGVPISTMRETTADGAVVARYALAGPVSVVERVEA